MLAASGAVGTLSTPAITRESFVQRIAGFTEEMFKIFFHMPVYKLRQQLVKVEERILIRRHANDCALVMLKSTRNVRGKSCGKK
jgi:hypothetical protein